MVLFAMVACILVNVYLGVGWLRKPPSPERLLGLALACFAIASAVVSIALELGAAR